VAEPKAQSAKVGETVEVKEGAKVMRPDGVEVTVTGGTYVLNQVGSYEVDGSAVNVKG
jgi:hypothetical protein